MRRTAALIVGGGPAGSAAAITLARGGGDAHVVERTVGPNDVVCGGFLGWDALAALTTLGIDEQALGARPINRLRLSSKEGTVEAVLPRRAAGLSRRTLDQALLAAAETAGARVTRGQTVRSFDEEARSLRLDDGATLQPDALILATGKHELRGLQRDHRRTADDLSVGLRAALPATPALTRALDGTIELHLFDGGYVGLLLQEDGSTNLCFSVAQPRLAEAGGPDRLIARLAQWHPFLGRRLEAGIPARWDAVAGVPYGWRARRTLPGVFRVGDQSAVIASLAGDGIAIALRSGIAAAEALLAGGAEGASGYQEAFAGRAALPVGLAETLRRSAERAGPRRLLMGLARVPGLAPLAARLTRIG